jgi:prepilin-type N-terminal cleavage/methylation domain-containing protein
MSHIARRPRGAAGYSLVELLVVVAIIAVLLAILLTTVCKTVAYVLHMLRG